MVLDAEDPESVLRVYVGMYLKEEVQAEEIVRHVGDFARVLEMMSFSHGSVINASNSSRKCQIARKTVDIYLLILEDLLLAFHIPIFHRKAKRMLAQHPTFYFFACGMYMSLRPKNLQEQQEEKGGVALEGFVAQHLKAWMDAQIELHQLYYWRTHSQLEVHFILSGPSCFFCD